MKKVFLTAIFLILILMFTVGCNKTFGKSSAEIVEDFTEEIIEESTEKVISMGEMNGNTYTNNYFDLSFSIPETWTLKSEQQIQQMNAKGAAMIAGDDEDKKEEFKLSEIRELTLVYAAKHELGYDKGFNSSILCICENLIFRGSSIKSGADHLEEVQKYLEGTNILISFSSITSEALGSKKFDVYRTKTTYDIGVVNQKMYSSVIDGYVLTFIITFSSEQELSELESILNTITFGES